MADRDGGMLKLSRLFETEVAQVAHSCATGRAVSIPFMLSHAPMQRRLPQPKRMHILS